MSDYSSTYPTQSPTFAFDAKAGKLDSRLSYSRSSGGTYMSNEKALSSENLLKQSQDFDTSWTASGIAAPTGSQTSPTGDSTAWLLTCNSGTAIGPRILQSYSVSSNTEYTMVAHLKAGTASHGYAVFRSDGTYQYAAAMLDFSAGTISVTSAGMTSASGTVTALGSNWFRVTVTATTSTSVSSPFAQVGISDGTAIGQYGRPSWNPAGTETMYAWGVQLSTVGSKVYDSPTTTQISREYSPLLKTAAADEPRFEFDASGNAEGLLIEAQATNLARYGSDVASWNTASDVSITTNAAVAPNSGLKADLVVATSAASDHYVYDSAPTISSGTVYAASVYVKDAGQRYVQLVGAGSVFGSGQYATFDLQTGSVDANGVTASAQNVGNGWYRIQMTMTATATGSGSAFLALANSATASRSPSFTGDDYSGVLIWGFQIETGAASSLVDTGTGSSQLSRAADSCSVVSASLFDNGEATICTETELSGNANDPSLFTLSDGTTSNRIVIDNNNGAYLRYTVVADGVTGVNKQLLQSLTSNNRIVATLKNGEARVCLNGSTVLSDVDASPVIPSGITELHVGANYSGAGLKLNGHIKRLAYYSTAVSETEAQSLSR